MINISKKIKKASQILNVYRLEREDYDYDEIIALAVVAESEEKALLIANEYYGEWHIDEKIDLTKPGVILEQSLDGSEN